MTGVVLKKRLTIPAAFVHGYAMSLVEQFIYNLYSSVLCSTDNVNVKIQRRQSISVAGMGSDDSSFSPGSAGSLVFQRNTIIPLQEGFRWSLLRSNNVTAAQEQVQTTDLCIFLFQLWSMA